MPFRSALGSAQGVFISCTSSEASGAALDDKPGRAYLRRVLSANRLSPRGSTGSNVFAATKRRPVLQRVHLGLLMAFLVGVTLQVRWLRKAPAIEPRRA